MKVVFSETVQAKGTRNIKNVRKKKQDACKCVNIKFVNNKNVMLDVIIENGQVNEVHNAPV